MRLVRYFAQTPADVKGAVVAIGNFDGLHRGHQALIAQARAIAAQAGVPLGVLTFEPHPRSVFQKGAPPFRLTPLRRKVRLLAQLGVEIVAAVPFTLAFAAKPAAEFVREVLVDALGVRHCVVGYDFAFGHRRTGNPEVLAHLGREHGFDVTVVAPQSDGGEPFAASRIRDFLVQGKVTDATVELGRYWEVDGHVRGGDRRGRALGFPTANLTMGAFLRPEFGIYAVRAGLRNDGSTTWYDAVAYLGQRPTFEGDDVLLEVHLLDFDGEIYGQRLRVAFVDFVRPDKKFDGSAPLVEQIRSDCAAARRLLAEHGAHDTIGADNMPLPGGDGPIAALRPRRVGLDTP
ncbi:MAG: bifunctional riboflavin kinase/FAD synthetase [Alphaproteobacteria bacterium]|nr:bifunctional riboflavin kinase/FAD synthetase [Alphaproteobacteria bacterium]